MSDWQRLGSVVQTQIHTDRMVNSGRYAQELIQPVDSLWLDAGMRGFVMGLANHDGAVTQVRVGDEFCCRG